MYKINERLINTFKEIKDFLYVFVLLCILGAIFYYFRVQKIHVFTGEWHWNLFKYYEMTYEKKYFIVFGVLFIIFILLVKKVKLLHKTSE
jgi:hypothetical protein